MLVFYRDDGALEAYLNKFRFVHDPAIHIHITRYCRDYYGSDFYITCVKGIHENARGYRADIVAVQEDLTWREDWPEIRDCVIEPMLMSPIPLQIFDGTTLNEAILREQLKEKDRMEATA